MAQQFLRVGLLDELQIHLAPVLIAEGIRLFDHLGWEGIKLERIRVLESPGTTPLRLRVLREKLPPT